MSSEDSDDEPLAVLAALKKAESDLEILPIYSSTDGPAAKHDEKRNCEVSITIESVIPEPIVVERPADVWLYLTDFNPTGPYTCLLCSEWFLNKNRIVVHYMIDHKKEYCGICRYLVPSREAWWEHQHFHMPWKCSQCGENCENQTELNIHFSKVHNLVHCRFCSLRLPDGDEYHKHLFQKHTVTQLDCIKYETLWDLQETAQKFLCLLCSKTLSTGKDFSHHYMSYHHFTLKCFTSIIAGMDFNFSVRGIDLTPKFIETELKSYSSYGYVDFVKNLKVNEETITHETVMVDCEPDLSENYDDDNCDDIKLSDEIRGYRGVQDFDIALVEVIVLQKCYFDYIHATAKEISMNTMPVSSGLSYNDIEDLSRPINCCFCTEICTKKASFEAHMSKAHSMKTVQTYWCRICAAAFDSLSELETHCTQELAEFEDLWICQFCDKEFNSREDTRKHLTEHFDFIEYDNCFSPHLGFKCKFCPILFWNETDRESHHVRVHAQKNPSDFYGCTLCGRVFGDKVFFTHHYLEEHDVEAPFLLKCCVCSIVLDNLDEMRSHFESEHPKARKTYCCLDDCQYRPFIFRKSLLVHLKTFHTPQARASRPTSCETCGQQFSTVKSCLQHCAQAHAPQRLACAHCRVPLHTADEKRLHYLLSHPDNAQYQCRECDKSFQHKSSLYVHKQLHKPNNKDYTCEYCGKTFAKRDSYREHMLIHEAPRHACSFCPMRFVQRSNMLRHERRHTGERPYSCQYCPRTFADKGACNSHQRTHQNTSFACMYCGQTFAQKSKLTYHIRKHTGENLETCTLCSKIFTSPGALREHMRTHQKQGARKTIKCPLCKKMYLHSRDMLKHMRCAHTATSQFQCPLCSKGVCSSAALREHVLTHSKKKAYQCKFCPKSYHGRKSVVYHLQKRHCVKPPVPDDFYRYLTPKECELGLDDDVLDKIFSNKKKKNTDVLIGDFVTLDKGMQITKSEESETTDRNEDENQRGKETGDVTIKVEPYDDSEEVPMTDFVDVKIEYTDSDRDEEMD